MKYTLLLASVAALQPVALALPQSSSASSAASSITSATGTGSSAQAVATGGQKATATTPAPAKGGRGARVDATFGESPTGAPPSSITIEGAQTENKTAIRVKATSSGPFSIAVELSNQDAMQKIMEGAKAAGLSEKEAETVSQELNKAGTNGTALQSEESVANALSGVAVAAARAGNNGTQIPVIQGCLQSVIINIFQDKIAAQGLIDVYVAAAVSGESVESVTDCAKGYMDVVKKAAPPPSSSAPASSAVATRTVTPPTASSAPGAQSSQPARPSQPAQPAAPAPPAQPAQPEKGVQAGAGGVQITLDMLNTAQISEGAASGCKTQACRSLMSINLRMTAQRIDIKVSMTILAGVKAVAQQGPTPSQGAAPPKGSAVAEKPSAEVVDKFANDCLEKAKALDGAAQGKASEGAQIVRITIIQFGGALPEPAIKMVEQQAERTAENAQNVPAIPQVPLTPQQPKAPSAEKKPAAPPAEKKPAAPPAEKKPAAPPAEKKPAAPPAEKKPEEAKPAPQTADTDATYGAC